MLPDVVNRLIHPSRGMKRTFVGVLAAAAVAGAALADLKPATQDLKPEAISVAATAISSFDREDQSKTTFGKLEWRGGLVLTAPVAAFGGWSGLVVDRDGASFVAISDAGTWMTGKLDYSDGRPSGLSNVVLGPIQALGGKPLNRGRQRDAESVALLSGSVSDGDLLISFEGQSRIGRFRVGKDGVTPPTEYLKMPPEMERRRGNNGIEAVTVLRGGPQAEKILAFAEDVKNAEGDHLGWIWVDKEPKPLWLTDIGGFSITDAASLDNGDLLVLERRFRWTEGVKARLRRIPAADVKPDAVLSGEVLMEADLTKEIDNMEGLGVHTNAGGETIVTMISDDNFNHMLQRTILLQFAITDVKVAPKP